MKWTKSRQMEKGKRVFLLPFSIMETGCGVEDKKNRDSGSQREADTQREFCPATTPISADQSQHTFTITPEPPYRKKPCTLSSHFSFFRLPKITIR